MKDSSITIETIAALSPVPVEFVQCCTIPEHIGIHWPKGNYKNPKWHIEILNTKDKEIQMATLIHEIQHAECKSCNCKCQKDDILKEFHAYKAEISFILDNKLIIAAKDLVRRFNFFKDGENNKYTTASKNIMKLELWKKLKKLINNA